jgi:hypothetical protein
MKNDLIVKFGEKKIAHQSYWSDELHVVDYTEKTKKLFKFYNLILLSMILIIAN